MQVSHVEPVTCVAPRYFWPSLEQVLASWRAAPRPSLSRLSQPRVLPLHAAQTPVSVERLYVNAKSLA